MKNLCLSLVCGIYLCVQVHVTPLVCLEASVDARCVPPSFSNLLTEREDE